MSGIELGLAVIATVDLCVKLAPTIPIKSFLFSLIRYSSRGKRLIELYAAYKGAGEEVVVRVKRVAGTWFKIEQQLQFIKRIEGVLDDRHREIQHANNEELSSKMNVVVQKLESVTKSDDKADVKAIHKATQRVVRPLKYVWLKESLDKAIEDLEDWQRRADPSWYLILKIADSQVDKALLTDNAATAESVPSAKAIREATKGEEPKEKIGIFLPDSDLRAMDVQDIPFCVARVAQRHSLSRGLQTMILSDVRCHPGSNVKMAMRDVRDLARKLQHSDPEKFGLLDCKGVVKHVETSKRNGHVQFTMVLRTPPNLQYPRSLRQRLMTDEGAISLSDKVDMARELAKAVNYVHVFGFVHKDIRPETVLTFQSVDSVEATSSSIFLVGFDNFRKEEGQTYLQGDEDWEKNLYRHPSRQGYTPGQEYSMQHDIYSLGVCLLEIGLWVSFVTYDEKGGNPTPSSVSGISQEGMSIRTPAALKQLLVMLARQKLPSRMGRRYCQVVETCLTCLDPDNTNFGHASELLDEDGILVGVRYIDKV